MLTLPSTGLLVRAAHFSPFALAFSSVRSAQQRVTTLVAQESRQIFVLSIENFILLDTVLLQDLADSLFLCK